MNCYPLFEYTSEKEGICFIQVFDTQGKLVLNKSIMAMHAGVYRERINIGNSAQGLYLVTVQTPTQYLTTRIFKR